jgi:hypothetical protein
MSNARRDVFSRRIAHVTAFATVTYDQCFDVVNEQMLSRSQLTLGLYAR